MTTRVSRLGDALECVSEYECECEFVLPSSRHETGSCSCHAESSRFHERLLDVGGAVATSPAVRRRGVSDSARDGLVRPTRGGNPRMARATRSAEVQLLCRGFVSFRSSPVRPLTVRDAGADYDTIPTND